VGNATGNVYDPNTPDKYEAGDLSGTPNDKVTAEHTDQYISLNDTTTLENGVIVRASIRIACANIIEENRSQETKQKRARRRRQMIN
ncbi:28592_t:CDS:2, partial [Gigaspora margarita]